MKSYLTLLALVGATLTVSAERHTVSINDGWAFAFPDSRQHVTVNLPHTYNLDAYSTRDYYRGKGHYRKVLDIPSVNPGQRYFLRFDAANKAATVTVNGHTFAEHPAGYSTFCHDITPFITDGANIVEVTVDNSRKDIPPHSADFTFWGGLYRDAWLTTTAPVHFDMLDHGSDGIYVTPQVTASTADIAVAGRITNDDAHSADIILTYTLTAPDGSNACSAVDRRMTVPAGETVTVDTHMPVISNPQLWSPDSPRLYTLTAEITDRHSGDTLDRIAIPVGLRFYEFRGEDGFWLNGQHLKLRGLNRHQDRQPLGVALPDEAHRTDIALMKELGCNFLRLAHYQQDDAVLRECDRLGIMVWEEIPVVNLVVDHPAFGDNCVTALTDMIRQHYNHPSVIGWGYMNEVLLAAPHKDTPERAEVRARTLDLARRLESTLHSEDSSRVSFTAFGGAEYYNDAGMAITDVTGWNLYQGWYGGDLSGFERFLEDQRSRFPERSLIVSEWGAGSDRRLHTAAPVPFDFSIEYQQKYIEHYMPYIESSRYLSGGCYWNFIDFNVAGRQESMPRVNNKGLVSSDRRYKDVAYYFKSAWRDDIPVVHIAVRDIPSVTGAPGDSVTVKVYSNCDEVELMAGGTSLGRKPTSNFHALFTLPLVQGQTILAASGMRDGIAARDAATLDMKALPDLAAGECLAINVGSNCDFTSDATGLTWLADRQYTPGSWGYTGGKAASTTSEIFNTPDTPLFQTRRDSIGSYRIDAPDGVYEVGLLFTDTSGPGNNAPYLLDRATEGSAPDKAHRMTVTICGAVAESDLVPAAAGFRQAMVKKYIVTNRRGNITVTLTPLQGTASLCGIAVTRIG